MGSIGATHEQSWALVKPILDGYKWESGDLIPVVTGRHVDVWQLSTEVGVSLRSYPVVGYLPQRHVQSAAEPRTVAAVDYCGLIVPIDLLDRILEMHDSKSWPDPRLWMECSGRYCDTDKHRASMRDALETVKFGRIREAEEADAEAASADN